MTHVIDPRHVIGENIRAARKDAGLTTTALAADVGLSDGYVARIERGAVVPSEPTLGRIAESLCVSVGELVGDETLKSREERAFERGFEVGYTTGLDDAPVVRGGEHVG